MKFIRTEPDGTRTEEWNGRVILNAWRGRYRNGQPIWPKPKKPGVIEITVIPDQRSESREEYPWQ